MPGCSALENVWLGLGQVVGRVLGARLGFNLPAPALDAAQAVPSRNLT